MYRRSTEALTRNALFLQYIRLHIQAKKWSALVKYCHNKQIYTYTSSTLKHLFCNSFFLSCLLQHKIFSAYICISSNDFQSTCGCWAIFVWQINGISFFILVFEIFPSYYLIHWVYETSETSATKTVYTCSNKNWHNQKCCNIIIQNILPLPKTCSMKHLVSVLYGGVKFKNTKVSTMCNFSATLWIIAL